MDTNRYLKAVNIEWDVDLAEDLDSLPKEVQIPDGMTDTCEKSGADVLTIRTPQTRL